MEISEIQNNNLERTKRLDAEFYSKKYLKIDSYFNEKSFLPLTTVAKVSDGNHAKISDNFVNKGIPYYRGGDIYNFFIENAREKSLKIPFDVYNWQNMERSHLKKGDVLMSIVGAIIGNLSLVNSDEEATCSCKLAILRPKNISSTYLAVYLQSKFGQSQVQRFRRGSGQTGFILDDFEQLMIFEPNTALISKVESLIDKAYYYLSSSIAKYDEANNLLLNVIGLKGFVSQERSINIKSFNESFLLTNRLDAEYYQPKFDEIVNKIKLQPYSRLRDLVYIDKSIEPGSKAYQESGLPFYRVSNITKFGLTEPDIHIDNHEYADVIRPRKDTILLTKDGTVGMAYKVTEDIEGVTSGAILHLNIKEGKKSNVLPDYLTLVLNSRVVQLQAERDAGGSIIKHWKPSEIAEVVIPVIDIEVQQQIADLVQESFKLKAESEQLLEDAKKLVEYAIEHGEDKALADYELGLIN